MEPSSERGELRKTSTMIVRKPNVEKLIRFAEYLSDDQRYDFKKKYGKILDLLKVNVQEKGISALAQFYDPPYKCFTFQDFQLVPTLEEFSQIMGYPLFEGKPYHYMGHYPSWDTIAHMLKVKSCDLQNKKINKNADKGISREYLENLLEDLVNKNDNRETFMDVLALIIYGIILFPSAEHLVSSAAISVFINYKFQGENPVMAVLADVFHTLNICRTKSNKRVLCCLPVLYVWMTARVFERGFSAYCPIADLRRLRLKTYTSNDWANILAQLKGDKVRWYPRWKRVQNVLYKCGDFPNVPIVGTMGCTNYNPALALRQLCYPIIGEPPKESYTVLNAELTDKDTLKKIRKAWRKVVYKGIELGNRSSDADDSYKKWVQDRVAEIKLPFRIITIQGETSTVVEESVEVKELKAELAKEQEKCSEAEYELIKIGWKLNDLRIKCEEQARLLKKNNTREMAAKKQSSKYYVCLRSANSELRRRNAEIRQLMSSQAAARMRANSLKTQKIEQAVDYEKIIAEYEKRNVEYKKHFAEYEKRNAEFEKCNAEHEKRIAEYEKHNAELEKCNAEHEKRITEYEKCNAEHEKRITEYEKRNAEHEKRNAEHEKRIAEYEKRNAEHEKRNAEHEKRIAEYEKCLEMKDEEIQQLKKMNS